MEQALRRAQGNLTICGVGIVLFGAWGFVKTILYNLFAKSYLHALLEKADASPELERLVLILWVFTAFIGALLNLYVGVRAIREGTGREHGKKAYLVVSALLLANDIFAFLQNVVLSAGLSAGGSDLTGESFMELVKAVNLAFLLYHARRARALCRDSRKERAHAN